MSWSGLVSAGTGMSTLGHRETNGDDGSSSSGGGGGGGGGGSNRGSGAGSSALPYLVYNTTGRELLRSILLHGRDAASSSSTTQPELVYLPRPLYM